MPYKIDRTVELPRLSRLKDEIDQRMTTAARGSADCTHMLFYATDVLDVIASGEAGVNTPSVAADLRRRIVDLLTRLGEKS